MNIEQVRAARKELEDTIKAAAASAVDEFRRKTGLSPEGIDIRMVEVTSLKDLEKRYMVGEVRADVPL